MNKKILITLPCALLLASCVNEGGLMAHNIVNPSKPGVVLNDVRDVTPEVTTNDEIVIYEADDGLPHIKRSGSSHVTYLMMSEYGSLKVAGNDVKGKVSELFYENTIVWEAEAGTALPSGAQVISSVGATFRGWAYYSEDSEEIFPSYHVSVPSENGLALKAIFD